MQLNQLSAFIASLVFSPRYCQDTKDIAGTVLGWNWAETESFQSRPKNNDKDRLQQFR